MIKNGIILNLGNLKLYNIGSYIKNQNNSKTKFIKPLTSIEHLDPYRYDFLYSNVYYIEKELNIHKDFNYEEDRLN